MGTVRLVVSERGEKELGAVVLLMDGLSPLEWDFVGLALVQVDDSGDFFLLMADCIVFEGSGIIVLLGEWSELDV